jgi:hypothetical protein
MYYKHLRVLLAIAAQCDLEMKIMDVETAFLNAPLHEEIYIIMPGGSTVKDSGKFLRLNRALYGLKQAGRVWNETVVAKLKQLGWQPCVNSDPCIFTRRSRSGHMMYIGLFVDDIPHFYHKKDEKEMNEFKLNLANSFKIKDLGEVGGAVSILGMRITRDRAAGTLTIDQQTYVRRMLKDFGMDEAKSASTPEISTLSKHDESVISEIDPHPSSSSTDRITVSNYNSVIGALLYAATSTRPDIAHAVSMASRDLASPTAASLLKVKQIMRYLVGTSELGIRYSTHDEGVVLTAYSDATWGDDKQTGRSTTGVVLKLCGAAVTWTSQKQPATALSSSESEYAAASEAARDIIGMRLFLSEINHAQPDATMLFIDNRTTISMARDEGNQNRRKHINIKHHHLREQVTEGVIRLSWIETKLQQADIMTKALTRRPFMFLRSLVTGLTPPSRED